jgi:hypothetical protein
MTNFYSNTERQSLQSFTSIDQLNHTVSIHMETLKQNSCKEKIMKLLSIMSQHSVTIIGVSWMSNTTMASLLDCSVRTVQRYIKELIDLSIIKAHMTKDIKRRGQTSNTYQILPVEPATEPKASKCRTSCQGDCHTKQSLKQPSNQPKEHSNVSESTNELILPTYIPERFAKVASLICNTDKDIVNLYSKVQLAFSKCNLDNDIEYYLPEAVNVLKGVIYKVKHSKVSNVLGYFYKGVLAQFDSVFYAEWNNALASEKVAV